VNSYEKIFCVSNYINSKASSILKDKKIITLYNGINIKNFDRNLYKDKYIDLRNQYKIKSSDIVIIYTGRLVPEKGIKELLEAFIGLKKASNIKLVIVGSSFFEGATKSKFIRRLELLARESKDKIIFTGYLPYHKMPEIYSIADIGIVPSIWEEPFGLTLIEQMAMSLPIIASDSGAFNEIINEKCSIIVKRGPNYINSLMIALDQLILNDKLRILLGQEARIQAELFTSEAYCKRFYTLIDKESNNG
jgi:glycosyltransferase involved in cell wall biosynthesis